MGVQGGRALLERDEDLRRIDALVEAAIDGRGAVLTVAGEAGIGKTTLLRAAAAAARGRDLRVIEARGGSLEREFAYGVVRQLLEGLLAGTDRAERAQLLSGAAAPAAALLDPAAGQLEADPGAGAAFAVAHALYWLVAEAAEREPLLLVVDDAHWGDAASLRWIVFLARRLAGMRAGLVLAWRTGRTGEHDDLLGTLSVEPLVEAVEPAPLSDRAVGALLEAALGAPAAGAFVAACHELTGGNPFLLRELVIAVRERGVRGTDEDVTAIRAMTPRTVSRSVLLRLAPLGDDARELARATAVLDSDAAPWLAARVAGLDERRATVAGDALQRADILEGMRFRHPLLRRAVYDELTPPQRSRTHRRAAEALCAAGEPEHGAVHLLATDPAGDPWVVEQLHAAALRALSRGAPAAAIPLLDRALREPPAGSLRPRLLLARGRAAAATLSRDAETLLRQALEEASDAETQAAAAHDLSRVLLLERRVASAVSVLDETRRRLAAQDPARAAAVEVEAGLAVAYGPAGAFADAERRLRQAAERAVLPVPLQIAASFGREWAEICADGRLPRRRARRLRATIEAQLDPALEALGPSHVVFTYAGMVLGTYGDLEAALEVVRTVIDTARGRGDVLAELMAIALRGRLFWYLGRLGEAESDGRIAFDAGTELAYPVLRGFAGATLAYAQAHRNELDEADAVLALFDLDGARDDATTIDVTLYGARAELRWAQGRPADALDDVETYFAVYARGDGVPPFMSVRALRTRALIALGRMDEARNWAREEVDRFRAEESAPEALGMSLAALGLAEGGAAGLALLDEAVAVLRHSQRRLELGRALIDQGAALRRARRRAEAREPLREGMEIAAVSGAPALVETARQELEATGARPRRVFRTGVDALTPSERRIASMAATGMTNSQIAQALFVTPKTVETHLRHVFQKLDVSSRGELGERLAA